MKYLWLVLLLACATEPEPEPEWIPTLETICVTNNQTGETFCSEEPFPCWTNTITGEINCDPDFDPYEEDG